MSRFKRARLGGAALLLGVMALLTSCESGFTSDPVRTLSLMEAGSEPWPDSVSVFDTLTVAVSLVDDQGRSVAPPPGSVVWSSSRPEVLRVESVDDAGTGEARALITALATGPAEVRATVQSNFVQAPALARTIQSGPLQVSFEWNGVEDLRPVDDTLVLSVLRTDTLFATVLSRQPDLVGFQWQSDAPDRLAVDSDPRTDRQIVLTGRATGAARLIGIVERPGFQRQEVRLDLEVAPLNVTPSGTGLTMRVGQFHTLVAQVSAPDGGSVDGASVSWRSSDPFILAVAGHPEAVDADGIARAQVVGLRDGPATVELEVADSDGAAVTFDFDVTPFEADSLLVGESVTASILAPPPEAVAVQWRSSDAAVLRVSDVTGDSAQVTGRSRGSAEAIARVSRGDYPSVEISLPLSVASPELAGTAWSADTINVTNTDSIGIVVGATQPSGPQLSIEWRSLNVNVARVVASPSNRTVAVVEGVGPGTVDLVATVGGGEFEEFEYRQTVVVGQKWRSVSAGPEHTCAINHEQFVYCWGGNRFGEVGDGSRLTRTEPVPVATFLTFDRIFAGGGEISGSGIPGLVSSAHTCAQFDRQLQCWGAYFSGQLGSAISCNLGDDGVFSTAQCSRTTPIEYVGDTRDPVLAPSAAISVGASFTCTSTESLASGDLGSTLNSCRGAIYEPRLGAPFPGAFDVGAQLLAGESFYCLTAGGRADGIRYSSGAAYCAGLNDLGQLGDGTTASDGSLVAVLVGPDQFLRPATERIVEDGFPYTLPNPSLASAGTSHSCVVGSDGSGSGQGLYCWGANGDGQLGSGDSGLIARRVAVPGAGPIDFVALGGNASCILDDAGRLFCWGDNSHGQFADGTRVSRSTPGPGGAGLSFAQIGGGTRHMCAIDAQGTLYCWGDNSGGQLGTGDQVDRLVPTRIREPGR